MDRFDRMKPETSQSPLARHTGGRVSSGRKSMNPSSKAAIIDQATLRELREALHEFEETKGDWSLDH